MMQCETFLVNQNIDGKFPGRGSEPTPQNLSELSQTVIETMLILELRLMEMEIEVFFVTIKAIF